VLDLLDIPLEKELVGVSALDPFRPVRQKVFSRFPQDDGSADPVSYTYDAEAQIWRKAAGKP